MAIVCLFIVHHQKIGCIAQKKKSHYQPYNHQTPAGGTSGWCVVHYWRISPKRRLAGFHGIQFHLQTNISKKTNWKYINSKNKVIFLWEKYFTMVCGLVIWFEFLRSLCPVYLALQSMSVQRATLSNKRRYLLLLSSVSYSWFYLRHWSPSVSNISDFFLKMHSLLRCSQPNELNSFLLRIPEWQCVRPKNAERSTTSKQIVRINCTPRGLPRRFSCTTRSRRLCGILAVCSFKVGQGEKSCNTIFPNRSVVFKTKHFSN